MFTEQQYVHTSWRAFPSRNNLTEIIKLEVCRLSAQFLLSKMSLMAIRWILHTVNNLSEIITGSAMVINRIDPFSTS
jgi:hypothetical protein